MEFKLGQKVIYKRISKKIKINMQYWTPEDFDEGEEKHLNRREFIILDKQRTGYIMGRRKLVFGTYFGVGRDGDNIIEPLEEWVEIIWQAKGYAYLVAYTMGKTNYVLEGDLKQIVEGE